MGIANGNESKKWCSDFLSGVTACRVLAVNPTAKELERLFHIMQWREPVYVGKNRNGTRYGTVRVYLETVPANPDTRPIQVMLSMTVNCSTYANPHARGEYCAIDPYGRLSWENVTAHDSEGLRWCMVGEDNVTTFLRAFLDIPYPTGEVSPVEEETCMCRLVNPRMIVRGDASEVRDAVMFRPDNLVNCLIGVRTSPDGNHRQCVFPRMFTPSRFLSQKAFEVALNRARRNSPYLRRDYYELGVLHHIDPGRVWRHDAEDHDSESYRKETPIYNDEIMISNDVW